MRDMAVDAAVGHQAHEVDGAPVGHGAVDRLAQHGVARERAVLDRQVDPGELLVDDPAGADVEVPDLGVAHLPLGQPDGQPGARDRRPWVRARRGGRGSASSASVTALPGPGSARPKPSMMMSATGSRSRLAPRAVGSGLNVGSAHRAAWTMSENESAFRAAPPTSAPSMSGSAKNMAAFSGLTEPP